MAEVKWTKEQQQAIYEKGSNILVAAAAGSGKTAVLVERMINKIIEEKVDIDKLLVVTFTNAAASEMRERVLDAIYEKLEKDPEDENLQRQITLLNKASICTIDSFCLEVVRNNFYEIDNISPNFRIGDTTEIELLKQEVIEEIFEKNYEEENEDFTLLINTYTSYKDDTPLKDLVLKIYGYIQSNPFPKKWLHEKIEMFNLENELDKDFSQTTWGQILLEEVEEDLIDSINSLEQVEEELSYEPELDKFQQTIRDDIDKISHLKKHLDNWDDAFKISQNPGWANWPRQKVDSIVKDEAKSVRDDIRKKLAKISNKILICDSKEANQDIYDMYQTLQKLEQLILEFDKEFSKRKRDKNIVDFNDIEHFALDILLKEGGEVAKRYQQKFTEIAIDEYQDSNLVQETILTSISNGNNIFMVGDVKQSIYKFRQAMPDLFLTKYREYKLKEYKKAEDNLKIQLFKNFRSRDNVLDITNLVFENIMSNLVGEIEYNEDEYLNLGADYPGAKQNLKTEMNVINLKQEEISEGEEQEVEERVEDIELEARFVASQIKKLIESKFQVWDKKKKTYRDIEYKDIVILLRATSDKAPIFEQEIINLKMPVFSDSSQEYLDSIEIQTILSLLKIIDNPMQDIPLVAVMRSPIGKFTDDELVTIRLSDKQDNFYTCLQKAKVDVKPELAKKIEQFLSNLDMWRKEQEYLALDELIWKIYSDTSYYHYVGLMPNGELRQANLKMLFERAKQYETASFKGLYNFINFIDKLRLSSGDLGSAKIIGENDNVVRIMSIHKSKGLEFPVVFLSNTGKQVNLMDLNQSILLHQDMGIGVKYIDYEKQVQYDTLTKAAIRNKIYVESLSEEMRILYVALTRAKEKLIVTGISKDFEKEKDKFDKQIARYKKCEGKINPILVKKYKKYMDWILLTYFYEPEKGPETMDLKVWSKNDVLKSIEKIEQEEIDIIPILNSYKANDDTQKEIKEILEFKYKNILATTIPTKTSVTQIKQLKASKQKSDKAVGTVGKVSFNKPKFLNDNKEEKLTGAQKGTIIHLCMQKLDVSKDYDLDMVKELVKNLKEREIITELEAENINPHAVLNFTKSKIWQEMKQAKEVYQERPFYIEIPAKDIYEQETDENVLVQGIIDLYYITKEGKLILVDYKTDYVEEGSEEVVIAKYKSQLELYREALESALSRKVDEIYIYSTWLGKEIRI